MIYFSRKRSAKVDDEIIRLGVPARVDGFDAMIKPLSEDLSAQIRAIAKKANKTLDSKDSGENQKNNNRKREGYTPNVKREKTPYMQLKKEFFDKINSDRNIYIYGEDSKKIEAEKKPLKARSSKLKSDIPISKEDKAIDDADFKYGMNLNSSDINDDIPDFDDKDTSIAGVDDNEEFPGDEVSDSKIDKKDGS